MTRVLIALLTAGTVASAAAQASAQETVCSDEISPNFAEEVDSFSVQCRKDDELEYASVQCDTNDAGANVSCSYQVDDPGDYCPVSISCNVYFLNDEDEIVSQVYVEEGGATDQGPSGLWTKTRIACGCPDWR